MMHTSYNNKFYDEQMHGSYKSASKLVPLLVKKFEPKSVIDVGCGIGTWLKVCNESEINDICGVDGTWVKNKDLLISESKFVKQDLTQSFNLRRKFDLCISLEVAEHIDERYSEIFVENLVNHSDIIVFAASYPNVRGTRHINCQWPSYWKNIFKKYNYECFDMIRPLIWDDRDIEWWYRQDTLVYINKKHSAAFYEKKLESPLEIVHPDCFEKYANPKKMSIERYIQIFPQVLFSSLKRFFNR